MTVIIDAINSRTGTKVASKATLNLYKPKIINSWWADAKGNKITRANLEDTVYFHIETEEVPDGRKIELSLYDRDMFRDDKLNVIEIIDNNGRVELYLPPEWTEDIKAEPLVHYYDLYWRCKIGGNDYKLPLDTDDYLQARPSNRDLHFNLVSGLIPDIRSASTGQRILNVELIDGNYSVVSEEDNASAKFIKDQIKGQISGKVISKIEDYATKIEVKFSNNRKALLFGALKNIGTVLSFYDILKFGHSSGNGEALPIPIPGADILGHMVSTQFKEINEAIDDMNRKRLKEIQAKYGADDIEDALTRLSNSKGVRYRMLDISHKTADKLLKGEFKTFEELENDDLDASEVPIKVLFSYQENVNSQIFTIESIYIND